VIQNIDVYQNNLNQLSFYFSKTPVNNFFNESMILENLNLMNFFTYLLNMVTNFAGNFSMIVFLLIFLVIEKKYLKLKIAKIITNKNKLKVFSNINDDIYNYFRIKAFTSFLTGILTFVILFFFNSDLAIAFGILSFFLNFIPYIGSLISIFLPVTFSIVENYNFLYSIITFALLFLNHLFIGNFLENKLMGKALNISPIVLLIFLSIMGKLWGISGMFLSVPIIVVLIIILNNFKQTKNIAILLSEKGNLK
jgi:predicted PurR-regulated permease PerM